MRYWVVGLVIALGGVLAAVAQTGTDTAADSGPPRASVVTTSWELEFKYEPVRSISVVLPGQKQPTTFWYLLYTVTNHTGADRLLVPEFLLYTDTGEALRAGMGVTGTVFTAIMKRHENPLLKNMADTTGKVLQGQDNAVDGAAIWPDYDPDARGFDVFIGGLNGERVEIELPLPMIVEEKTKDGEVRKVEKHKIVLARTLQLSYSLVGEAESRLGKEPTLLKERWVMR